MKQERNQRKVMLLQSGRCGVTAVRAPIIAPGIPKSPPSAPGPALSEEPESHPPCYSGTFSSKWGPSPSHSLAWLSARATPAPGKRAAALAQRHPEDLAMPGSPRALQARPAPRLGAQAPQSPALCGLCQDVGAVGSAVPHATGRILSS